MALRRINFQIHLWTGILLALYVSMIGITGSILVFGAELTKLLDPNPWPGIDVHEPAADLASVIASLSERYPRTHIVSIMSPTPAVPVFTAVLQGGRRITVGCDSVTGQILRESLKTTSRLDWVYNLHEDLLARRTGRVANGTGAALLLLLIFTGLVNWWRHGLNNWRRAFTVDFRRRWKRINFDLHSAVGVWSFALLTVWAASGMYFTWPAKAAGFIDCISPLVNAKPPVISVDPNTEIARLDFNGMISKAYTIDAGSRWKGIVFPASRRSAFEVLMSRSPGIGRDNEDTLYFNPYNGEFISIWRYGVNRSLGDWLIWLQTPLHFGTHWGLAVKCLWAALGLSMPLLAATGLLMYWNRVLSKWFS